MCRELKLDPHEPGEAPSLFAFSYRAKCIAGTDGRVLVEFVNLPRVATDARDVHEVFAEAIDALGSDLSIRISRREAICVLSLVKRGFRLVPAPVWLAPELALYLARRGQRTSNSELARGLGVHERVVPLCKIRTMRQKLSPFRRRSSRWARSPPGEVRDAAAR